MTNKIIASMLICIGLIFVGAHNVSAQMSTNNTEVSNVQSVEIRPVGFFDKVKLFFTFNTEKRAGILQDFSQRSFSLATQNLEQGNNKQAEVFLQKSDMDMSRASLVTARIIDAQKREEITNRISNENKTRIAVLIAVQSRMENPVAAQALDSAMNRRQVAGEIAVIQNKNTSQNQGNRSGINNDVSLGSSGASVSVVNSTCTPTSTPYIKVLSPNGGEVYQAGQQIEVKWESCNTTSPTININLMRQDSEVAYVYRNEANIIHPWWSYNNGIMLSVDNPTSSTFLQTNAGVASVTLPLDLDVVSGQHYFIMVHGLDEPYNNIGGFHFRDWSNGLFTINESSSKNPIESGDDENGQHIGYVQSVSGSGNNYSLVIDYIQWVTSCTSNVPVGNCMNGFQIINSNTTLRTFPISSSATVQALTTDWEPVSTNVQQFANSISNNTAYRLNWITLENGVVTEITPQYTP